MAITSIERDFVDSPNIVRINTSDTLATVGTAGYLTNQAANLIAINFGPFVFLPSDLVLVYSTNAPPALFTVSSDLTSLVPYASLGAATVTLPVVSGNLAVFSGTTGGLADSGYSSSDPTKTKIVMAGSVVLPGFIAHFVDTAGTIDDTAGNIINAGNIQAGISGIAGTHISFPPTAGNGSLILAATNAGGAFNTSISNGVMGQSTVYSMADIGAATGGIPVSTLPVSLKFVRAAVAAGGAAAQSFTDAFCTATSVVLGQWVTQANAASVLTIVPGNGSFVVTSTANAGAGTFSYLIQK